ncbi:MAG: serine/threonine-protein kinase [Planctomycetota bacterium]
MELTPETKDALVGLFAVKLDLCTERSVEKALAKAEPGKLLEQLTSMGKVERKDHPALLEALDPDVIPGYRIEAEAGRGGMGVVYRARQTSMDRVVALKLLSRSLADDESYVAKFLDEARSAAKLNHENVVGAINAGEANGLYYFVMEFVDGSSVSDRIERDGAYPYEEALRIGEGVARGLQHAHEVGLVHRDVKPENVVLTQAGEVRLCDLGLAKPLAVAGTGEKSDMTEGTPYYCSPEQALGRTDIDARSDVYSLAMTLYHMIVGEPAYEGDGARDILVQQVRAEVPDLDQAMPQVPAPIRALLARMLVKDREDRLPSMQDFLRQLDAARRAPAAPQRARRREGGPPILALVAAGLVALVGLAVVGYALVGGSSDVAETPDEVPDTPPDDPPEDDPPADDPPPADETPQGRRARRRPPSDDPPSTDSPPTAPATAADAALEAAREYALSHPDDPRGAYERLRAVATSYPGGQVADDATRGADALLARVERAGNDAFTEVGRATLTLVGENRYREASAQLDAFHEAWRDVLPEIPALEILRRTILDSARTRLKELEAGGDAGAVRAFRAQAPESLGEAIDQALARLEQAAAQQEQRQAFRAASDGFWRDLLEGEVVAADAKLRPFAKQLGDPFAAEARELLELSNGLMTALQALQQNCEELARKQAEVAWTLDAGGEARGKVQAYDAARGTWTLLIDGERRTLELAELSGPELAPLAAPTPHAAGRALLFLRFKAPHGARAVIDRAESSGAPLSQAQRDVLEPRIRAAEEALVDVRIATLLAAEPEEAVRLARGGFSPALRATETYRRGFEQIKQGFLQARGAQLAADPAALLAGDYKEKRTGMGLEYRFESQGECKDLEAGGFGGSKAEWKGAGNVVLHGRVALRPRFAPGTTLKIQAKLKGTDAQRPNVNLLLESAPWRGVLIGFGYRAGTKRDVTIDPAAERKGGYTMALPCNVIGTVGGQSPPQAFTCLDADYQPSILGETDKVQRIQIDRTKGNDLRVKLSGRSVFRLNNAPGDEACQLVFAPFNQDVVLSELEITGELDPAWLQAQGEALAAQEAANLPAPL